MKSNRKRFSPPLSPGLCSLLPLQELQQRLFILFVFWATTNSCLATQKPDPDTSCAKVRDNHDDNIEIKIIGQKQCPGLYIWVSCSLSRNVDALKHHINLSLNCWTCADPTHIITLHSTLCQNRNILLCKQAHKPLSSPWGQGTDPAKNLLSTSSSCSGSAEWGLLWGQWFSRSISQMGGNADLENQSSFSAPWLCPCPTPVPATPVPWHSHQCRPCQMVQGVLEVQEGLVVQFLEGTGEKWETRAYFSIRRNIRLDQKSVAKSYSLTPNLHPLPAWVGPELLQNSARFLGKPFWLSTSPAPFTGNANWSLGSKGVSLYRKLFWLQTHFGLGRGGNAKPMEKVPSAW